MSGIPALVQDWEHLNGEASIAHSLKVSRDYAGLVMLAARELPPEGQLRPIWVRWDFRWALIDGNTWLFLVAGYEKREPETFWGAIVNDVLLTVDSLAEIEMGVQ